MVRFSRYIGIDYSGASTPTTGLPGIRVWEAFPSVPPREVLPHEGTQRHWTRQGIAAWLEKKLSDGPPALIGIDHGFSFPQAYFETHRLPLSWESFLEDFCEHWPTEKKDVTVEHVRQGLIGKGTLRGGNSRWRRLCEQRSPGAKSVFHFDVPGSVAKSTHAGLPWLLELRKTLGARLHFWPFDGWSPEMQTSVITEVYPSMWNLDYARENRSADQHDAYSIARWMRDTDANGRLTQAFHPYLTEKEQNIARFEGWILGLT
ncbi:MAG: hypothetical protein RI957_1777 [Verrucomicrobiota bacterium]|jgi:hypothetical protein